MLSLRSRRHTAPTSGLEAKIGRQQRSLSHSNQNRHSCTLLLYAWVVKVANHLSQVRCPINPTAA